MKLKTAGLRKHSGKSRLPLKTRLHKPAGITDGCRDSYPLWTHRMLTGLRCEAGKGSNNVIHRMIQPNSLPNFPVKGKSLAVRLVACLASLLTLAVVCLEQQGHHNAMMLSQLWVLSRLPPWGGTYLSYRHISRTSKYPVLHGCLHTTE